MYIRRRVASLLACLALAGCASTPSPTPAAVTPTPFMATDSPAPSPSPSETAGPTLSDLVAADLDGVLVDPVLAHRLPLVVSIDDSRAARPQSGFNAASIVFQAPADGYESRYIMVFQELDASDIGPVRSSRIYLAHWASELMAGFAHYGGDRLTLAWLRSAKSDGLTNIDGIGAGNPAYHRISSRDAPHNAYTSSAALQREAAKLGGATAIDPSVHLRPFRDDGLPAARPASQTISIPYHTVLVGYAYDPITDSYARSLDGQPQIDPLDNARVTARTVVVLSMAFHTDNSIEPGHNRPVLGFVGSGPATIFMEGVAIAGRWSKASELAPTLILGSDGTELPLIRGRIFIQVVPTGTRVTAGT